MSAQEVYMTTLTSESYIPGVIALKKSLIETKTKHPLVVLIPENEADKFITLLKQNNVLDKDCFCLVKPNIDEKYISSLLTNKKGHLHWIKTFFKLAAASCTEFKKIVLLDSDLYIQNNIDSLFNAPNFSAVASLANGISSGVLVIDPPLISYKKLLACIEHAITKRKESGKDAGDQDVFSEYCPNWAEKKELLLPKTYNCHINKVGKCSRLYNIHAKDIYVVHFWGRIKPWNRSYAYNILKMCMMILGLKFSRFTIYKKYLSLTKN